MSIHSGNHLLVDLLSGVDGNVIDGAIPLGPDEIELRVFAKRSPLCIDDHVPLALEFRLWKQFRLNPLPASNPNPNSYYLVDRMDVGDLFEIASICSGAKN